jgi:hypothetical protein
MGLLFGMVFVLRGVNKVCAAPSTDDETFELMPSPVCRIILDPEFFYLAVNDVGDLTKGIRTTQRGYAVGFIHGLHIHSTIALPGNHRQHMRTPIKIVRPQFL